MTRRPRDGDLRSLGHALEDVSRHLKMAPPPAVSSVFGGWRELVGESMAAHVTPRSLRDGLLTLVVDDPVWATQLRFLEGDLLERLRGLAGAEHVRSLRVVVRPPKA